MSASVRVGMAVSVGGVYVRMRMRVGERVRIYVWICGHLRVRVCVSVCEHARARVCELARARERVRSVCACTARAHAR